MAWKGFNQEGTIDSNAILVGDWSEILAQTSTGKIKRLGNCPEGTLEIGREFYEHINTAFPRKTDLVVQTRVWMKFTGVLEEIHNENVSFLLGQTIDPGAQRYLYVGALGSLVYFTFRGRRVRISDSVSIEFKMHKCLTRNLFTIAGGDEAQGSPIEVEALDDTAGDWGGSSTMPLGWIYVPRKT